MLLTSKSAKIIYSESRFRIKNEIVASDQLRLVLALPISLPSQSLGINVFEYFHQGYNGLV